MTTTEHGVLRKNWLTAFVLSLLLGGFGIDRFYLGKAGTGILKLLTLGGFGIWALIDFIMIATKNINGIVWDNDGKEAQKKAWIIFGVAVVLCFIIGLSAGGNSATKTLENNGTNATDAKSAAPANQTEQKPAEPTPTTKTATPTPTPTTPSATVSQKNALSKAKDYISYTAFSHDGLVAQLEYEKFSTADAMYGADNVGANWNEQAAKKAKDYMEYSSFSRQGLIDQLVYEKFTNAQATFGADSVGL